MVDQVTPLPGAPDATDAVAVEAFERAYPAALAVPVVIVIAAYDEEGSVGDVVRSLPSSVAGRPTAVVVVVDGATDATAAEARAAGACVCDVPVNRGQGAALRLGYLLARRGGAEVIVTTDADGQYDPADIEQVARPVLEGRADFVSGSRRLGRSDGADRMRSMGVVLFAGLISLLTGHRITDPANGLRAMTAAVTERVRLAQPQYQAAELLIGALVKGFRVIEVPTSMRSRSAGASKKGLNLAYGWRFGAVVVRTWWRERSSGLGRNTTVS